MRLPIGTGLAAVTLALAAATSAVSDLAWPASSPGLAATVRGTGPEGPVVLTLGDRDLDVETLARLASWPPRQPFAIDWAGWIEAPHTGRYRFLLNVDDGAVVAIDGRDVVAVEGAPGIYDREGELSLERGWHRVSIRYRQVQGGARFAFRWIGPGESPEMASPQYAQPGRGWWGDVSPGARTTARIAVALGWSALLVVVLLVALARWMAPPAAWRQIWRAGGWPLAGALLVSAALITVHVTWGAAPLRSWYPDELLPPDVLGGIDQRFAGGWYFLYPPLHFYLTALILSPMVVADRLGLQSLGSSEVVAAYHVGQRLIGVAMSMAILLAALAAGRETIGVRRAVIAVWLIGTAQVFVFYARTAHVDLPYAMWLAVAWLFFLRAVRSGAVADHVSLGIAVACAVGTKDQAFGYFVVPGVMLAYRGWRSRAVWAGAVAAFVGGVLAFGLPWNLAGFRAHLDYVTGWRLGYFRMFDAGPSGQAGLAMLTLRLLPWAFGTVAVAAAVAGVVVMIRRPRFRRLGWLALPLASYYICSLMPIGYVYDRFLLGWAVPVGLFAALGLWHVARALAPWRPAPVVAIAAALAAAALPSVWLDLEFARHTRGRVERWLAGHVPPGGLVLAVGMATYLPDLSPYRHVILDQADDSVAGWHADVMILNEEWLLRFERPREATTAVLEAAGLHEERREPAPGRPWWLALASGPVPLASSTNVLKVSQPYSMWTRGEGAGRTP